MSIDNLTLTPIIIKSLQKFKYAIVTVAVFSIAGCTSEIVPDLEAEIIENPDYEIIRSLGFITEGIIETDDSYIIEGDIVFDKNSMQDYVFNKTVNPAPVIEVWNGGYEWSCNMPQWMVLGWTSNISMAIHPPSNNPNYSQTVITARARAVTADT